MESVVYIPHFNTDHKNFIYRGSKVITNKMYLDMEKKEHEEFQEPIDVVMDPAYGIFGNNMARNPFWSDANKRKLGIKAQKMAFACSRCRILNKFGAPMSFQDVKELVDSRRKFLMIIQFKEIDLERDPELLIDIKSWVNESMKILNSSRFTDEEKVMHLPMKTLPIEVRDGEDEKAPTMQLVFRDCKVVEKKGDRVSTVAVLVKRVDPYVDPQKRKVCNV